LRCVQVIAGVLGRAGEAGQEKRLADAKNGNITWLPPPGLGKPRAAEEETNEAGVAVAVIPKDVIEDEPTGTVRKGRRKLVDAEDEEDDDF
jgi:small subunit ribosomal protein S2